MRHEIGDYGEFRYVEEDSEEEHAKDERIKERERPSLQNDEREKGNESKSQSIARNQYGPAIPSIYKGADEWGAHYGRKGKGDGDFGQDRRRTLRVRADKGYEHYVEKLLTKL